MGEPISPPQSTETPELRGSDRLRFLEFHRPPLESGDYALRVEHRVWAHLHAEGEATVEESPHVYRTDALHFSVTGERLSLGPASVHGVYPPLNSVSPCHQTLPHVVLERSTLPWERKPCPQEADHGSAPWLALLVFTRAEAPTPRIVEASTLRRASNPADAPSEKGTQRPAWPGLDLEAGQHETDAVKIIEVPWAVLDLLLPSHTELRLQAHVRGVTTERANTADREEQATLVANRLPMPGTEYVAHVVSLEGRYKMPAWGTPPPGAVTLAEAEGCGPVAVLLKAAWDAVFDRLAAPGGVDDLKGSFDPGIFHEANETDSLPSWQRADAPVIQMRWETQTSPPSQDGDTAERRSWGSKKGTRRELFCDAVEDLEPLGQVMPLDVDEASAWCDALLSVAPMRAGEHAADLDVHDIEFTLATTEFGRIGVHVVRIDKDEGADRAVKIRLGFLPPEPCFDAQGAEQHHSVRLVSLHSWSFSCAADGKDLVRLLTHLDVLGPEEGRRARAREDGMQLDAGAATPALPEPLGLPEAALPFLWSGYTVLPHQLRTGDRVASWYRGPLLPRAPRVSTAPVPARGADQLLIYDDATALFDASFSAAWTLGRLLALEDVELAVELVHWKQRRRRAAHLIEERAAHPHVAHAGETLRDDEPPPPPVARWFGGLQRLEHVPFAYLVPDERLLPVESLRAFTVDPDWIACLVDGAFSVGRVLRADALADEALLEAMLAHPRLSGILLRSEAVRGFPGLEVDAWALRPGAQADPDVAEVSHPDPARYAHLTMVRQERLGPDVLLCLFDGGAERLEVELVDLHLHPQTLHFGVQEDVEGGLIKSLRDPHTGDGAATLHRVPFRDGDPKRGVVDMRILFEEIAQYLSAGREAQFTAADFAFQLLDAAPLVRFIRGEAPLAAPDLESVEGIGSSYAEALRRAGITSLTALRSLILEPEETWPTVEGVSSARLRRWAYHAELLLIPGVDEHFAELLEDVGVAGLPDLRDRDAQTLRRLMTRANASRRRAPRAPSLAEVSDWVAAAGTILDAVGGSRS